MKKNLINIALTSVIAINMMGCFGESISCSGEVEKDLVKEIALPEIKEKMLMDILNEKSPGSGLLYITLNKLAAFAGKESNLGTTKGLESLSEAQKEVESEYSNLNFLLSDIRTLAKNKEINSVECAGKITVKTSNYELIYKVNYNAQLGDDKKKDFVEISTLE